MLEFGGIALLRPWWLLAPAAVVLLAYFCIPLSTELAGWHKAIEPTLLAALKKRGAVIPGTGRTLAWAFTGILTALALVGPALERPNSSTFRNLDGMAIVFDVSRSMEVGGRMAQAGNVARAIIEAADARQVELIVYAGDAYLVSPFTTDTAELSTTILALDGRTVPDPGTRPTRAIALARRTLAEANVAQGDVVLISDGGGIDVSTLQEAAALAQAGHCLTTLFVPAKNPLPDTAPMPDRAALAALAAAAHGMHADVIDPSAIIAQLGSRPAVRLGQGNYAVLVWKDYGRLAVAAALFPALLLFRRRG